MPPQWIELHEPSGPELEAVARDFGLHELAVEDALKSNQRPKLERYDDTLFLVLRPARYVDETETVEFGELEIFTGPDFVVTVGHGDAARLDGLRDGLDAQSPAFIVHAVLDRVVDGYAPVVAGLDDDIGEIEEEVFGGSATVSRRIYELSREVISFQRATRPLDGMLGVLMTTVADEEERRYLRDVHDHVVRTVERADAFRALLQNILTVNLTLAAQAQNEQVKRISAWAAILFAPTLVGTNYGMNFTHMPELEWTYGYPFAIGLMLLVPVALYLVFKRRRWI